MRFPLTAVLLAIGLLGCNRTETGRTRETTDTLVTTRQTQDTTLITHDTTVKVDTSVKRGERTLRADTVKKTTGTRRTGSDTDTVR
jgi:hypothetical protein